jgi:hypothetical protein
MPHNAHITARAVMWGTSPREPGSRAGITDGDVGHFELAGGAVMWGR